MTPFSAFFHPSFIKCEFSHLLIQPVMPYDFQQTDKAVYTMVAVVLYQTI